MARKPSWMWFLSRLVAYLLYLSIPLIALLWWVDRARGPHFWELDPQAITRIEIEYSDFDAEKTSSCSCDNPQLIASFVRLLQSGEKAPAHLCAAPMRLKVYFRDGSMHQIEGIPGHHEEYYEFGRREIHRINRKAVIQLLEKMGVKKVPLKC